MGTVPMKGNTYFMYLPNEKNFFNAVHEFKYFIVQQTTITEILLKKL